MKTDDIRSSESAPTAHQAHRNVFRNLAAKILIG